MAKISQVSAKYIVHATIEIEGVVDRPDVIGAIFGQTEGLLGADLELRELQSSGRIGRIEVNLDTKAGKTKGAIVIPSSLDKAETAIIAAALEIIQRIGPCNAKIKVEKIEDVRVSKRHFVVERAKELLKQLTDKVLQDSQEIADEVAHSVRVMEIQEYGKDRLPAGPAVEDSEDIIVVEGRADVLTLLKHGFKNVIAMNGTSVPQTIIELSKQKTLTAFVDGDRGGDLNIQELLQVAEVDFVTKAPDGKEVEELTKKEIHKALRSRMTAEQAKSEFAGRKPLPRPHTTYQPQHPSQRGPPPRMQRPMPVAAAPPKIAAKRSDLSEAEKKAFKQMLEDLIGTRGAYILDQKLNILGKVPVTELVATVKSLNSGIYAIILDGSVDKELLDISEKSNVRFLVGMDAKVRDTANVTILTAEKLD
ncbi:MAG: DNA primase [Nanoarchaeota archaeon]|nr:DNA primase [Nanoarchaeota archaeon]